MRMTFVQWVCNGYGGFSSLYKSIPWLIYDGFLTHWIPEDTLEKRREVFGAIEWRSSDCKWFKLEEINHSLSSKCAWVLGQLSEGQVKTWELVTLGVWRHLNDIGDREVLGEFLEFVGAPRREDCSWFEPRHSGDGERAFLVKTCFLVMQGSDTLSGCSNMD